MAGTGYAMTSPTDRLEQLLRSYFDTTGWGPKVVREHVTRAVLAIEAEAFGEMEQHRLDAESWRAEAERIADKYHEARERETALREALAIFANPASWDHGPDRIGVNAANIARAALAKAGP